MTKGSICRIASNVLGLYASGQKDIIACCQKFYDWSETGLSFENLRQLVDKIRLVVLLIILTVKSYDLNKII